MAGGAPRGFSRAWGHLRQEIWKDIKHDDEAINLSMGKVR